PVAHRPNAGEPWYPQGFIDHDPISLLLEWQSLQDRVRGHARGPDKSPRRNRLAFFELDPLIRVTAHPCFRPNLDSATCEFALRVAAEVSSQFRKDHGVRMHEHDAHVLFRDVWIKAHRFAHEIV